MNEASTPKRLHAKQTSMEFDKTRTKTTLLTKGRQVHGIRNDVAAFSELPGFEL